MAKLSTLAAVLPTGLLAGRYVPADGLKQLLAVLQLVHCCRWPWGWTLSVVR
jgi:hypothetical protein